MTFFVLHLICLADSWQKCSVGRSFSPLFSLNLLQSGYSDCAILRKENAYGRLQQETCFSDFGWLGDQ